MPAAKVQVRGAKELRAAMAKANADMKDWTRVHEAAAQPVATEARHISPRQSGDLSGSHKVRGTKTLAKVQAGSALVPYAGPIHFGWPGHNIEANPWLWKATDEKADAAIEVYEAEVEKVVRKIDRMTPG